MPAGVVLASMRIHKIFAVLLLSAAAGDAAAGSDDPAGKRPPPPDASAPRALLHLRSELFNTGRDGARAQMAHFRALCDDDGYPLVGNLANKANLYQPSAFCADVRAARKP